MFPKKLTSMNECARIILKFSKVTVDGLDFLLLPSNPRISILILMWQDLILQFKNIVLLLRMWSQVDNLHCTNESIPSEFLFRFLIFISRGISSIDFRLLIFCLILRVRSYLTCVRGLSCKKNSFCQEVRKSCILHSAV